ncbi:alkaline phosphatase D family protein [Streptomyces sp. M19]
MTLEDYRLRYALYKTDKDLQAAHAAFPGSSPGTTTRPRTTTRGVGRERHPAREVPDPPGRRLPRVLGEHAAAHAAATAGPDMRLYRRFQYGRLAQFDILDTRQYRSNQANGDGWQYPTKSPPTRRAP